MRLMQGAFCFISVSLDLLTYQLSLYIVLFEIMQGNVHDQMHRLPCHGLLLCARILAAPVLHGTHSAGMKCAMRDA